MKTFATMFSGGELFGVGAQQAGFTHLWGIEYDDKIASVARLNDFNVITGDVCNASLIEGLPSPDHLHASPPCPNFSVAKTNGGETAHDISMSVAVCNAILAHKPETFSMENVRGYVKSESFKRIIATLQLLGYMIDSQVVDAADFGVPQNRLRLIVRAKRNGLLQPFPPPVKWVGWYSAIEDVLDTLPETEFAPWQMERLPQAYRDFLIGQGSYSQPKEKERPADTITANSNQIGMKAFLMAGAGNTNMQDAKPGNGVRYEEEPSHTVASGGGGRTPRAFICYGGGGRNGGADIRHEEEPVSTMRASVVAGSTKAFIVDEQPTNHGSVVTIRDGDTPMFTVQSSQEKKPLRAHVGRVVKMTVQALGRFQTVPDTYKGLTTKINGNGVPCLLARKIMETMK